MIGTEDGGPLIALREPTRDELAHARECGPPGAAEALQELWRAYHRKQRYGHG